jgi:hypothetical protein
MSRRSTALTPRWRRITTRQSLDAVLELDPIDLGLGADLGEQVAKEATRPCGTKG